MKTSLLDDAEHWRSRAEEMRALAEAVPDPVSRRKVLQIVEDYEQLAARADEREKNHAFKNE